MGLAGQKDGLLLLEFTSFNGAVNGGNEGENLISGIFCCSYGVWLVVTHPVRCVWLPTAPTAFWWLVGVWTPWRAAGFFTDGLERHDKLQSSRQAPLRTDLVWTSVVVGNSLAFALG